MLTELSQLIKKSYTREDQFLDKYLCEIGEVELLSANQEVELTRKIKKGSQTALDTMTKANLRFVVSVAKQYQNQGLYLGDLITKEILDSSRLLNDLMNRRVLNSYPMRSGGYGSQFC